MPPEPAATKRPPESTSAPRVALETQISRMVLEFYRLQRDPFGVTPDPSFLFPTATHREALASLRYGLDTGRGFLALIARPGMGKTTLLFSLLEHLRGSARTIFLFQTLCDPIDLIRYLLKNLGVNAPGRDMVDLHAQLNELLYQEMCAGRRLVLIIDEAQNLSEPVLETARLLSNFETTTTKLMQMVLAGQPELAEKLDRKSLSQLRQRISVFSRLEPLTPADTFAYIEHRLGVAGSDGYPIFTHAALERIADYSEGIPRNINNLCFNALGMGCALEQAKIGPEIVREVASDLGLIPPVSKAPTPARVTESPRVTGGASMPDAQVFTPPPQTHRFYRMVGPVLMTCLLTAAAVYMYMNFQFQRLHGPAFGSSSTVSASAQPMDLKESTGPVFHVVQHDETLAKIALSYFGFWNPAVLREIRELNPDLVDPNQIKVGQSIRFPREIRSDVAATGARPPASVRPQTQKMNP